MEYWSIRFHCTEQELRTAVALVGPLIISMWRYLLP
ncbi:DUF3606 domain-containing protein [Siccationidurans soli]|uniref:DUF3606 domain-containing protein n=1 Tax=Hymenobacter negativus TaxID=2795026 RepID=A0ABS3QM29_9BACT|nr:DUF3606 domain-containing protein [Hymenobacter negativus]